ncbi:MAG: flagellar hook-length control protein FliK [Negativicutes bacterium]
MQTITIIHDVTNLNAELYSAQVMPENGKQTSGQFNNILKTVQEKSENAKSLNKKNEHIDEDKTQSIHNESISSEEKPAEDVETESLSLQNSSNMPQQNQTQNLLSIPNLPLALAVPLYQAKDRPLQPNTIQNNSAIQTTSIANFPVSSVPNESTLMKQSQVGGEASSSTNTHLPQTALLSENGQVTSGFAKGYMDAANPVQVNQQNKTKFSFQATANAVQERDKVPLTFKGMAIQINNISVQKNELFQNASKSEGVLISEEAAAEPSLLETKITFPISLKQTFQQANNAFSGNTPTDPETLLLKDNGDSDVISIRDAIGYHDILSSGKLTATAPGTMQAASDIDPQKIVTQIVDHARLTNSAQNSEMVIKLNPEHLGELTLKVAVSNGLVTATFHSNNSDVRTVLEASILQLKQEMVNSGIKVNYVGVYAGLDQFFSGGQHGNSGQQLQSSYRQKIDGDAIKEVEAWTVSQITDIQSNGVDYRI